MKKRRKPDFLFVLAVLVGIGVIATMKAQAGAQAPKIADNGPTATVQAAVKVVR